jgi:cyclopropane-fatty-acyl-phospholipid synthase
MMVMQIQIAKRQGVVPITRDYMAAAENRLRGLEPGEVQRFRLAGE